MSCPVKASAWLQRRVFPQRYMGRHHTGSMTFCARVWIEDWLKTERLMDFVFGKGHCLRAWHNWVKREGL